jgi:Carboxypeptidase regulatory-like domain
MRVPDHVAPSWSHSRVGNRYREYLKNGAPMIKLQTHVQILLIVGIVGICPLESFAAFCAPPAPFRCSLPTSPVAFIGTVISKQDVDPRPVPLAAADNRPRRSARSAGDPVPLRDNSYISVTFRVTEGLRGDFEDTIVIRTHPAYSSASYPFEIDGEYLVFAGPEDGYLYTSSCTGNAAVATEAAFIRELRAARGGSRMSEIFGAVSTREGHVTPLANVTVTATADAGEYRTVTAADGTYEFRGLAPGRYAIAIQPPPMREASHVYSLDVGFQGACRADFELYYSGQIGGTVTDLQGRPLLGTMSAVPIGIDQSRSIWSADVVEGRFELKRVRPGRYRLRFVPTINGRMQPHYYYYPGTGTEREAAEIEIGDGTVVTGLSFIVPYIQR